MVESWNAANGFIFYGRGGELSTNRRGDQVMGLLCLHLLQSSLVYINTLMIQRELADDDEHATTDQPLPECVPRCSQRGIAGFGRPSLGAI